MRFIINCHRNQITMVNRTLEELYAEIDPQKLPVAIMLAESLAKMDGHYLVAIWPDDRQRWNDGNDFELIKSVRVNRFSCVVRIEGGRVIFTVPTNYFKSRAAALSLANPTFQADFEFQVAKKLLHCRYNQITSQLRREGKPCIIKPLTRWAVATRETA